MRILKSIKTCIKSIVGYFVFDEYREINNIFLKASSGFSMSTRGLGGSPKKSSAVPEFRDEARNEKYCEKYTYLLPYQNPIVKKAIWNMKYRRNARAIDMCADIFYDEIVADLSDRVGVYPFCTHKQVVGGTCICRAPYIVYSPSSSFALGQKNYDHMQMVAKSMEKYFDNNSHDSVHSPAHNFAHICHGAILYNKDSGINATQHTQNRSARKLSAKNRFKVSAEFIKYLKNLKGANSGLRTSHNASSDASVHIICLDDVTTTGATFDAIRGLLKKELRQNCKIECRIDCIALCH